MVIGSFGASTLTVGSQANNATLANATRMARHAVRSILVILLSGIISVSMHRSTVLGWSIHHAA
jgi:hypothetical protein